MVKILQDARAAEDARLLALTPEERAEYQRQLEERWARIYAEGGLSWEDAFQK